MTRGALGCGLLAAAPGDLGDEWGTLYFAWEGLADAFDAAGTTPRDYRRGETSDEVTVAEDEAIQGLPPTSGRRGWWRQRAASRSTPPRYATST